MSDVLVAATAAAPSHCYFSKAKTAQLLRMSVYHVGLLAKQGELETIKIGRRNYITLRSVRRFKRAVAAPPGE